MDKDLVICADITLKSTVHLAINVVELYDLRMGQTAEHTRGLGRSEFSQLALPGNVGISGLRPLSVHPRSFWHALL